MGGHGPRISKERRRAAYVALWAAFAFTAVVGLIWLGTGPAVSTPNVGKPTSPPSVWDRAFTDRLLDLLRIGLVLFGAVVAATIAQRLVLGRLAFKAGPIEFEDLVEEAVSQGTQEVNAATEKALKELREETNQRLKELADIVAPLAERMAILEQKVAELERRGG